MVWKRRALVWGGLSGGTLAVLVLAGVLLLVWAAKEYTRVHPLDLTARLPQVQAYLLPDGIGLQAEKAELFFDDGPVLHISGLGVTGPDGSLGVFIEDIAVKFATTQMLALKLAPKEIVASGMTLRVVRNAEGVSLAGFDFEAAGDGKRPPGVVNWLNSLGWGNAWGRLKRVLVTNLNLLVRDDVQNAEWVLENGRLAMSRYPEEGENGTVSAFVRRLYGDDDATKTLDNVPVLVRFEHGPNAPYMVLQGRLDHADARMVTDYFPPQFKDLLQAQGRVEIGTRLLEDNKLERPWVSLGLTDVKVHPGKAYGAPLEFKKLDVTASYVSPEEGVSGTDVLLVKDLQVTTGRGAVVAASGTIVGLQGGPMLVDVSLASAAWPVQGVFDFFPDNMQGFVNTLAWVRPNIMGGDYSNLVARYRGDPHDLPRCADACGVLEVDAGFTDGKVRYLADLTPAEMPEGRMSWRGQNLEITAPEGRIGEQRARGIVFRLRHIFDTVPTLIEVNSELSGPAAGVMAELNKIDALQGDLPLGLAGTHRSQFAVTVPLARGHPTTFASSTVVVSGTVSDMALRDFAPLQGLAFTGDKATYTLDAAKRLRVVTKGELGGLPMAVDWSMSIQPGVPSLMALQADGRVTGSWLMRQAKTDMVQVEGPVSVKLDARRQADATWAFEAEADGRGAVAMIPAVGYSKPLGRPLALTAQGRYAEGQVPELAKIDVKGENIRIEGSGGPGRLDAPNVVLGRSRFGVKLADKTLVLNGPVLDVSGFDVLERGEGEGNALGDLKVKADFKTVLVKNGQLDDVSAALQVAGGEWNVSKFRATVEGTVIAMERKPLPGQPGRSRMTLAVADLGRTLKALGVYHQLEGGRLNGEMTYDSPTVGGGVVRIEEFTLDNPSLLVQLLSLLSLEQLLSGSTSTMFKQATLPLRVDGPLWHLDNASLQGPSMDMRLTGTYDQEQHLLNMDGKLAPGIPLNRLVSKIPVLGTLLTGSQDGVVVADFKIKGSTADPQVNVRPLSVITPGLLKDFWRGVTGPSEGAQ